MRLIRLINRNRQLTLLIVILVLSWALAFATGFWLLFRVVYVLAIAVPLAWLWARFNVSGLEVTVQRLIDRAQVGQKAEERIIVRNPSWFPRIWLEVDDPSDLPGATPRRVITLGSRRRTSWKTETPLTRRGVYQVGPVTVTSSDPFGVFKVSKTYGGRGSIIVYPPFIDLPNFTVPPASLPGEGRFRKRTHYVTPNASGVREYAAGDSFNRIHWGSTARTGKLMVKMFELDPASDIWVILDLYGRVQAGSGDESTVEYGVKIGASVARHFLNANRNVGYMAFGNRLDVIEVERGGQQMTRILESLAMATGTGDVPIANLLAVEGKRFGRHTTVVLVTPSTDEEWITSLLMLTQRGVKVAVVLIEASTFGASTNSLMVVGQLTAADIWTYLVKQGDNLSTTLTPTGDGLSIEAAQGRGGGE
ncbi:MAG: DUF58 domain-containing protein [Dehalococcoidia bacterium]